MPWAFQKTTHTRLFTQVSSLGEDAVASFVTGDLLSVLLMLH